MAALSAFQQIIVVALVSGCIGTVPCKNYVLMWMESGRRSSDFNSIETTTSICDAFLPDNTWYRFEHDAGNRLIETPVDPYFCGTQSPIWMNGTHPTDTTEVTAKVCATYTSENRCGWNGTIRIQLCNESGSEYFVYLLAVPPGCPLAYCVDAASRKQCIPPLIWLENEFKCGENISTTPTTAPSTEPPSSGWGTWGPWSDCSKPCDFGLQTRRRTCGQLPCTGNATSEQLCATSNCEELPEEKDKGIVLSLQSADTTQDAMLTVVENQQTIDTILRSSINSICSQNVSLCCGFKIESISSENYEFVTSDDIYAAKGFPKLISDGIVDYKIIAIINEAVYEATCNSNSIHIISRQAKSADPNFVPFEVMEMAARKCTPDILQETGLVVKDYIDPTTYPDHSLDESSPCPVATCIVPIVVCCAVIPIIAIIIGCITLQMMKKSKTSPRPTYEKDRNLAAPTMVHPHVDSGHSELGSLPGKPS